jgi:ABC-type transport system involved in multi-copper enzyme maturation permease subunit
MLIEPFLRRELVSSARRRQLFQDRFVGTALVTAIVAGGAAYASWNGLNPSSVFGVRLLGQASFGFVVAIAAGLSMVQVPMELSAAIASERDRKSLDSMLATRFRSAEIVLGTLTAGLIKSAARIAALAPLIVLVVWLGGIDPILLLLVVAGVATTALALGALAVAVSATARTARKSASYSISLAMAWMCLPIPLVILLPRLWPAVVPWVVPALGWLLDSSPLGVFMNLVGVIGRGPPLERLFLMMQLQLGAALALVCIAIWRLRPASRAVYDLEGRSLLLRSLRSRRRNRPSCGDDPVLWNEMYTTRGATRLERIASSTLNLLWAGLVAVVMSVSALPALLELFERGYVSSTEATKMPDLHPLARQIVARASGMNAYPARGQARLEFNIMLRQTSAVLALFYALVIAGSAAESVSVERERDTWLGLIVTPLGADEILRAKTLGAFWRVRGLIVMMIVLWTVGVLIGALHPLGYVCAIAGLALSGGFFAAWGVRASLWAPDRKRAVERILPLLLVLSAGGFLALVLPLGRAKVFAAACSAPFLIWSSLLSYEDVSALFNSGPLAQLRTIAIYDKSAVVMTAWLAGTSAYAIGALYWARASLRGFDDAVDRPRRTRGNPEP